MRMHTPPAALNLTGSGTLVHLEGISKRFRDVVALDGVSFDIRKGEIFGYIGPNGAGKTTTIKIMVGLIRNFEGGVTVGGHSIRERTEHVQSLLGYLPQKAAFQEWRTVDQALTTFGRLNGMSRQDIARRIPEVLGLLGVADAEGRKIVQLSGGTVQKVGFAQAIVHNPELLVLDEPMSGLDPASRFQFKSVLKDLARKGSTIFFSSHILSDVQDIADRVGILVRGKVMHVGNLEELTAHFGVPKDIEVVLSFDPNRPLDPESVSRLSSLERRPPDRLVGHVRPEADIDEAIDALNKGLVKAGYRIRSMGPVSPDLEELYMRYVGGGGG